MKPIFRLIVATLLLASCVSAPRPPIEPPQPVPRPTPEPTPPPPVPEPRFPLSRGQIEALDFPDVLPVPVDGVAPGELASSFGAPRSGGRRHEAIDIFAPRNTPVRATVTGWVSRRGSRNLGGRTISVVGPGGYRHYYAHLEAWAGFAVGDRVRPGDILGYVGNSGNARGGPTHLHYGIYRDDGEPIDPYPLLRRGPGPFE